MKPRDLYLFSMMLLLSSSLIAQLRAVNIQKLPLDKTKEWASPQFSPDGKLLYLTTSSFNGIWEYALPTQSLRQITNDQRAGFGFAISPDGKHLAYRRTSVDPKTHERLQEIVLVDVGARSSTVLESGETVSTPTFARDKVVYTVKGRTKNLSTEISGQQSSIIGIENTKIALNRRGKKVLLDPLKGGSYVWPSLSPDGKRIVAYEMEAGTFICDLDGKVLSKLGRRDAPTWTRDGKWIVFMRDADDGHDITSSEIWCISTDGKTLGPLTGTESVIEVYPDCSPTENKVVCTSLTGEVFLISYEETRK
jgi:Tol biopolymer transport system component